MSRAANSKGIKADFLGAFAVLERDERVLMVQNRRIIAGRESLTWDLPGGRVEPGELLEEALLRELREETKLESVAKPRFLFYQEGERVQADARSHTWRSFFFALDHWEGEARAAAEILDTRWMDRIELRRELQAPYHDSFLLWLERGGSSFSSSWCD